MNRSGKIARHSACAAVLAILVLAMSYPLSAQVTPSQQPGLQPGRTPGPETLRPLGLDEAIRLALRRSPQAIQAEGNEQASRAARVSAIGAIFPSASLSMGRVYQLGGGQTRINQNGEQVEVASRPTSSTGLSMNMTLFDGGARRFDLRRSKSVIEAAEANRVAVRYDIALQVKRQFYAVLAALESKDAARIQMEQAEQQFRSSVAKVRAGVATRSDSLRGVIQVGNAQLALITAESNLSSANAALTRIEIGRASCRERAGAQGAAR